MQTSTSDCETNKTEFYNNKIDYSLHAIMPIIFSKIVTERKKNQY